MVKSSEQMVDHLNSASCTDCPNVILRNEQDGNKGPSGYSGGCGFPSANRSLHGPRHLNGCELVSRGDKIMIWFDELTSVLTHPLSHLDSPTARDLGGDGEIDAYISQCIPARATLIGATTNGRRSVGEWTAVFLHEGKEISLPVAAVGEGRQLRIYHSMWPILGRHEVRSAILPPDYSALAVGTTNTYFEALDVGSVEDIVKTFAEEGYFREPSGEPYVHRGADELRELYTSFFSAGGGVSLEHTTVTIEGNRTALEYNCVRWGTHLLPSQAGVAVYREGVKGLLAVHVYDDVAGPVETSLLLLNS